MLVPVELFESEVACCGFVPRIGQEVEYALSLRPWDELGGPPVPQLVAELGGELEPFGTSGHGSLFRAGGLVAAYRGAEPHAGPIRVSGRLWQTTHDALREQPLTRGVVRRVGELRERHERQDDGVTWMPVAGTVTLGELGATRHSDPPGRTADVDSWDSLRGWLVALDVAGPGL